MAGGPEGGKLRAMHLYIKPKRQATTQPHAACAPSFHVSLSLHCVLSLRLNSGCHNAKLPQLLLFRLIFGDGVGSVMSGGATFGYINYDITHWYAVKGTSVARIFVASWRCT